MPENTLFTYCIEEEPSTLRDTRICSLPQDNRVAIDCFWNGDSAFEVQGPSWANLTQVYSLWNSTALFFYFECWFSSSFDLNAERGGENLGEERVAVMLRPSNCKGCFEITVDTAGRSEGRYLPSPSATPQRWNPQMQLGVQFSRTERIERTFLELPYESLVATGGLGGPPQIGDAWRLNLHRTAIWKGKWEHLSWRPVYGGNPASLLLGHLIFLGAPS